MSWEELAAQAMKEAMMAKTYTAIYERDSTNYWFVRINGIAGCHTQGRTIAQARKRIREVLPMFVPGSSKADILDDVRLPNDVSGLVRAQKTARTKRKAVDEVLQKLNVKAAQALTVQAGLSLRDAGELLGASQESVRLWSKAS